MKELKIIEAVKKSDLEVLRKLVAENGDAVKINEQDEHGWTALHWAAGSGDTKMVELLIQHGADTALKGTDERTPLMVAKAANRMEVVRIITAAEKKNGQWIDPAPRQAYCKAYHVRDLSRYPHWSENILTGQKAEGNGTGSSPNDNDIVYLHQDFTVTKSMWANQEVIFSNVTPEWQGYCRTTLQFAIPEDIL